MPGSPMRAEARASRWRIPKREAAYPATSRIVEPDQLEHVVGSRVGDAGLCRDDEQVGTGSTVRVEALVENRADDAQRVLELAVAAAVHSGRARGRVGEPEQDAHRGRLARSVAAQERGDPAGLRRDGEAVECAHLAVVLDEWWIWMVGVAVIAGLLGH